MSSTSSGVSCLAKTALTEERSVRRETVVAGYRFGGARNASVCGQRFPA